MKVFIWTNVVCGSLAILAHTIEDARALARSADSGVLLVEHFEDDDQFDQEFTRRLSLAAWDVRQEPDSVIDTPQVICCEDRGEISRAWQSKRSKGS